MISLKICLKVSNPCCYRCIRKKTDDGTYLKNNDINFYRLKDFDTFINLIDKGIVEATFKINVFRREKDFGKYMHGTTFEIQEGNLLKLYDKINI